MSGHGSKHAPKVRARSPGQVKNKERDIVVLVDGPKLSKKMKQDLEKVMAVILHGGACTCDDPHPGHGWIQLLP